MILGCLVNAHSEGLTMKDLEQESSNYDERSRAKKSPKKEEGPERRGSLQAHKEGVPVPLFWGSGTDCFWGKQLQIWEGTTFAEVNIRCCNAVFKRNFEITRSNG